MSLKSNTKDYLFTKEGMMKPTEKPKRPLSAYNIFFKFERHWIVNGYDNGANNKFQYNCDLTSKSDLVTGTGCQTKHLLTRDEIMRLAPLYDRTPKKRNNRKTHGKIGFAELARTISIKWKSLRDDERRMFDDVAREEKDRYKMEMLAWKDVQSQILNENKNPNQKEHEQEKAFTDLCINQKIKKKNNNSNLFSLTEQLSERFRNLESDQKYHNDEDSLPSLPPIVTSDSYDYDGNFENLFDDDIPAEVTVHKRYESSHVMNYPATQTCASLTTSILPISQTHRCFVRSDEVLSSNRTDSALPYFEFMHSTKLPEEIASQREKFLSQGRQTYLSYIDLSQITADEKGVNSGTCETKMFPNIGINLFDEKKVRGSVTGLMDEIMGSSSIHGIHSNCSSSSSQNELRRTKNYYANDMLDCRNKEKVVHRNLTQDIAPVERRTCITDSQPFHTLGLRRNRFAGLGKQDNLSFHHSREDNMARPRQNVNQNEGYGFWIV